MTDRQNDQLNDAIDAVLAGKPAMGADEESLALARLAANLQGMPSPEFKSRLAAELFPQGRRSFIGRIPVLNRIQNVAARRVAAPFALASAAAIAALAVAVVVAGPFGGSSAPAEAFGKLPVPQQAVAAPIQNGSGAITWQLSDGMVLPDSAPAYRLSMPEVTVARAEQLAHAVGVEGAATTLDYPDRGSGAVGYQVGAALDCKPVNPGDSCGSSFDIWTTGWFSYRSGVYPTNEMLPDDATAKSAASAWLQNSGLTNGEAFELTIQPPPIFPEKPLGGSQDKVAPVVAAIIAQPKGHNSPDNGPMIQLTVDGQGNVIDAGGFWATIVGESDYHLHSADQLLAELQAQRGSFDTLETEYGNVSAADVTAPAVATVANVALTYKQATPADDESPGQVYLVPIYQAKVDLQQNGTSVAGFVTWVAATGPTN